MAPRVCHAAAKPDLTAWRAFTERFLPDDEGGDGNGHAIAPGPVEEHGRERAGARIVTAIEGGSGVEEP